MLGTSVPEATVHKYNKLVFAKSKVGLPKDGKMSPPAGDFILTQQPGEGNFRGLIATSANA